MKNEQILYKLTDENCRTYGGMLWEVGKTNYASGKGNELCTGGVLHAYADSLLAVLLNPIHADFKNPRIFLVTGDIVANDGSKVGSKWQRVEHETDLPKPSIEVRTAFAILCGLSVYNDPSWRAWAWNWLDGTDRTANAAAYAANAAYAAAYADSAAAYAAANAAKVNLIAIADMAFKLVADGV